MRISSSGTGGDNSLLGARNAARNGSPVVGVVYCLSCDELASTLREGHHDGAAILLGGLHAGVDAVAANNVDTRHGKPLFL